MTPFSENLHFSSLLFNWSMTYKKASDIHFPFGGIIQKPIHAWEIERDSKNIRNFVDSKTRMTVWLVTNCRTVGKREQIVRKLKKFTSIDVLGDCGKPFIGCPRSERHSDCEKKLLNKEYRFHLAFENCVCDDYVTEKYYARWNLYSIPVVLKRKFYDSFAPPHSFIAVDDFSSLKKLGEYMNYLGNNKTAYRKYFEWRYYLGYAPITTKDVQGRRVGFCRLCERMLEEKSMKPRRTYINENLRKFWNPEQCDHGEFAARYTNQGSA